MSIQQATAVDPKHPANAGSASVVCLMSVCAILAAGTAVLTVMTAKQAAARRAADVDQAYLMAEAGVDLALSEIKNETDYDVDGIGVVSGTSGRGTFTVTLTPAFAGSGDYTITSTGRVDAVSRTIDVEIDQETGPPGFAGYSFIDMSDGLIDTYDSSAGTYASQVVGGKAGTDVEIASNGFIKLSGGAEVWGDATPGPGNTVMGSGVSGSTAPATSLMTVPTYTYAPPIASAGNWNGSGALTNGTYRYGTFTVSGGNSVTISGDVVLYLDDDANISGSAFIKILPGASLTIHQGPLGDFTISGSGVINQDQDPAKLNVHTASTGSVTFSGSSAFYGSINAPQANITCSGSAGIYGSAQGKELKLSGGMSLHYDKNLGGTALHVDLLRPRGRTARKS